MNAIITIKLRGTAEEINMVMKLEHVKLLLEKGVKIKEDIIVVKMELHRHIDKKRISGKVNR